MEKDEWVLVQTQWTVLVKAFLTWHKEEEQKAGRVCCVIAMGSHARMWKASDDADAYFTHAHKFLIGLADEEDAAGLGVALEVALTAKAGRRIQMSPSFNEALLRYCRSLSHESLPQALGSDFKPLDQEKYDKWYESLTKSLPQALGSDFKPLDQEKYDKWYESQPQALGSDSKPLDQETYDKWYESQPQALGSDSKPLDQEKYDKWHESLAQRSKDRAPRRRRVLGIDGLKVG